MNPEACAEMNFIIDNMSRENINKIPEEYIRLFKDNKSMSYVIKLDNSKPLNEQELLEDTKTYLSAIYREFLCSEDEKIKYEKQYQDEMKIEQHKMQEMLKDDIFYNEEARKAFDEKRKKKLEEENQLIVYKKDNIFSRILKSIKKLFGGKNND